MPLRNYSLTHSSCRLNGEAVSTSAFCALRFLGPTWITFGKGEISVTETLHDGSISTDDVSIGAEDGSICSEVSAPVVDDDLFGAEDGSIGSEVSAAVVDDDLFGAADLAPSAHRSRLL